MNPSDVIIILVLFGLISLSWWYFLRRKKRGEGCCNCGCDNCNQKCKSDYK